MTLFDLNELSANAVRVPEIQTFSGQIAEDATDYSPVGVVIPEFDQYLVFGPAPWVPVVREDGIYFPKKGDRALIVRPSELNIWIAAWEPKASEADSSPWSEA